MKIEQKYLQQLAKVQMVEVAPYAFFPESYLWTIMISFTIEVKVIECYARDIDVF